MRSNTFRSKIIALFLLATSPLCFAQLIAPRGIVNGASFMPAGLPGGSIAQGSLFSIFGVNLGPSSSPALTFPLATTLGGVSVKVTEGTKSVDAIPVFVSAGQINAIMPSNAPLGRVSIRVTTTINGAPAFGPVSPATVVGASFGVFSAGNGGFGPGLIQDYVSQQQTPLNSPSAPAQPGQLVMLYGTGLGPIQAPDNVAPPSGNLASVEVFVGGQAANVLYHGRSSCCSGLDQINFQVPSAAPAGCWVPVQARINGAMVSNTVTMAISADGSPCSDPANALSQPFLAGQKIGAIAVLHSDVIEDIGYSSAKSVLTDAAMLTFQQEQPSAAGPFHPIFSLPPVGTCSAYTAPGDLLAGDSFPGPLTTGSFLNAGSSFNLNSPGGLRILNRPATNERNFQPLGSTFTGSLVPSTLYLVPANYVLTGFGGADVGPFTAKFTLPSPFGLTWTNRAQTETVDRTQPLTLNWTGAPSGQQVIIFGAGVDVPTNTTAMFVCLASSASSSFTVPSQILANIPAARTNLLQSKGVVYVGALPVSSPVSFTANGLDAGAILPGAFFGKTVIFQ